jgi:hypothetical protein
VPEGFRIATAYVAVEASDAGFRAQLDAKIKEATEGVAAKVKLEPVADGLAEKIRAEAAAADAETHVHVKVDDGTELRSGIERLGQDVAGDADQAGAHIGQALGSGLFRDANGVLRNSSGQFASEAEKIAAGFDSAGRSSENAGRKAQSAGSGFRMASVGIGATGAAAIALLPALAAIPGLAAGAAAGVATLAGAFFGVGKALHDYGAQQNAVGGGGGGGSGGAAYSNAVAIRGAEQAIADAREQGARSAQQSAEQVQNAQRGVVDAERNAATAVQNSADQIVAAQQRVNQAAYAGQQAQQAYTNALYNEQQAEKALVDAKASADNQLVDSQNAAADAHLAVEDAANQAKAAQAALKQAQDAGAGPDQLAILDLAARKAAQQLAEAKQREKEAVEKANAASKAGVDQAPAVLSAQHAVEMAAQSTASAQHGVAQAAQQQTDAQAALAKAQKAAADQQITSDEQVAKARQNLADAQRQADQQREDSAKAVTRAEQNLTDTLKEQQLAAQSAGASGGAAANKYADDMKNLSQAGRDFVLTANGMRGELHQLSLDAQTATLPGFTQMLKDSEHLLPTVRDGVQRTGHALSDMAAAFGRLFANQEFDDAAMKFERIVTGGFGEFTSALPPLLNAIVTDGVRAAPLINAVAGGIHDLLASGLPDFLDGLTTQSADAAVGVGALFQGVEHLLGPVGMLAGSLGGAMGPALGDLVPALTEFADEIEQSLLPIMPELSADLKDAADVTVELLKVAEPLVPLIAEGLGDALRIADPLLKDTAGFLHDNAAWLTPVAEGVLVAVAAWKTWQTVSAIAGATATKFRAVKDAAETMALRTMYAADAVGSAATKGFTVAKGAAETMALKTMYAAEAVGGTATTAVGKFGGAAKKAGEEAEVAGKKVGGAGGFAGKLGQSLPIIGAAVAAGGLLVSWLEKVGSGGQHAAASVDKYTLALLSNNTAALGAGSAGDAFSRVAEHLGGRLPSATTQMSAMGTSMALLDQKMHTGGDALKNYDGGLANLVSSGHADEAKRTMDLITAATDGHGHALINTAKDFPQYFAALDHQAVEQQTATTKTDATARSLDDLSQSVDGTAGRFQHMSDTMSRTEALDRYHAGLLNLKDAADQNGTALDGNTKEAYANKQQFSDLADQIQAYGKQLHDAGFTDDDVAKKMQGMVGELTTQAGKFGYSKDKVDAYIKSLGLIPSSVSTTVNQKFAIKLDEQALQRAADQIDHVVGHHLVPGNAAGGLITGPGTGTSDSIPRRLSNGEFVEPADSVQRFGVPFMEAIRHGQMPTGLAAGPSSSPPVTVNFYGTQYPTAEQQQILIRDLELAVRG